jgi:hypothetical protein
MNVSCRAFTKPVPKANWVLLTETEVPISENLPAVHVGEIVGVTLKKALEMGFDPKAVRIILQFS